MSALHLPSKDGVPWNPNHEGPNDQAFDFQQLALLHGHKLGFSCQAVNIRCSPRWRFAFIPIQAIVKTNGPSMLSVSIAERSLYPVPTSAMPLKYAFHSAPLVGWLWMPLPGLRNYLSDCR